MRPKTEDLVRLTVYITAAQMNYLKSLTETRGNCGLSAVVRSILPTKES